MPMDNNAVTEKTNRAHGLFSLCFPVFDFYPVAQVFADISGLFSACRVKISVSTAGI